MKSHPRIPVSASRRLLCLAAFAAALPIVSSSFVSSAFAATTISYANPAIVTDSAVSSTSGSANITVPSGTWAVGDVIRFTTTSPLAINTRYYVVSVSGTTLQVSATPGGTALTATSTTTTGIAQQGFDWLTSANWTGGTAPNSNSTIADFGLSTQGGSSVPIVINGAVTVYGTTFSGNANGDLTLVSGANGTGLNALTFATDDASTPKMTMSGGTNAVIFLGTTSAGSMALKIAGTQGLIFNSSAGGAITGSGATATSTAPGKQIRLQNIDWSSFSGGIQVERGFIQLSASNQLPNQTLTVGNAQTITNNTLAGLNLNGSNASIDALAGNSLGRIWGTGTLTMGAANGSGSYAGAIGKDFTGALAATIVTKTGSGTQTFTGVIGGTGAVNVNVGTVVYDGATISTTGNTTVASGATLRIANAVTTGTTTAAGRIFINSGSTLTGTGTLTLADTNTFATSVSMGGTFAPGTNGTIGTFTVNAAAAARSAWAFEGTGTLAFDLGASVTSDTMAIVGKSGSTDVFFNSNTINFNDLTSGSLVTGDYLLFDGDTNADYSGLTLGSAFSGTSVTGSAITAGLTIGTGVSGYASSQLFLVGNDIYLNVTASAIPEPSTYAALAGLGVFALAAYRRRRVA